MPTSASILTAIGEIITGAKYKANQMRPLLQDIFNVCSSFFSGTSNPGSSNDNTQNYRLGSLGRNTNTGRYFICANANTANAVWDNINNDFLYSTATFADGSTTVIPFKTAYFKATGSGSIDEATFKLPVPTYVGKTVEIYVSAVVTTGITIVNQSDATVTTLDSFGANNIGCIKLVCTDAALQTWEVISLSYP